MTSELPGRTCSSQSRSTKPVCSVGASSSLPSLTPRSSSSAAASSPSSLGSGVSELIPSEDLSVSNMPRAATLIAAESVCTSTGKKYDNLFKKFVSYGDSVGKNVMRCYL